jgi:hypothetical protein
MTSTERDDDLTEQDLKEVRALVAEALADAEAGRFVDPDRMFEELRARYSGQ